MKQQEYEHLKLTNPFVFDFHKLACLAPQFQPYVLILNCRTVCNFKDQNSLIATTKAILKHYFGIEWKCPFNNLCPRVPARLNYLLWVYLQLSHLSIKTVLDIGTGATLIYPLLGWSVFGWKFIATEVDRQSFEHSQQLILLNGLQQQIDLRLMESDKPSENDDDESIFEQGSIIRGVIDRQQDIDVVVCNPPFFQDQHATLTNMTHQEHHTRGGEYAFIFNTYRESFSFPNIKYFTCLVGLLSNFTEIKAFLIGQHEQGYISALKFGEIRQGNNLRFIVLWQRQQ